MKKSGLIYFLIFLIIFVFVFRSLILNLTTHLLDWLDYPLVIWIIHQNLEKITALNFANFFNSNAFYPHTHTLLFADSQLPQTLIALPFSFLSKNPILVFNFVFIITFILNYFSSFLFWKTIFKKKYLAFLGALLTVFSVFLHLEISHFQMLSFWPFFFSLYFLLKQKDNERLKNIFLAGLFLAIQFLACVYLGIFLWLSSYKLF